MDPLGLAGLMLIPIVVLGLGIPYVMYIKQMEPEHHPWEKIAALNKLNFTPRRLLSGVISISGSYRGYHLILQADPIVKHGASEHTTYDLVRLELLVIEKRANLPIPNSETIAQNLETLANIATLKRKLHIEPRGLKLSYEENQRVLEIENAYYQPLFDQLCDLMDAYPHLVSAGSEIIPALEDLAKNETIKPICHRLIADIATDSKETFQDRAKEVRCPTCWTVFDKYTIRLSQWNHVTGYACRTCGQSIHFLPAEGGAIAVLDSQMSDEVSYQGDTLRLNWLQRRGLFDFTVVEIINASDEDVERFAVQVGNDTDAQRPLDQQKMVCTVASTCVLSENTLRILAKTFGEVVYED